MKKQHLQSPCPDRLEELLSTLRIFCSLNPFLHIHTIGRVYLFSPSENTGPPPLYTQPRTIKANLRGGYSINQITGKKIEPILNNLEMKEARPDDPAGGGKGVYLLFYYIYQKYSYESKLSGFRNMGCIFYFMQQQ